MLELGSSEGQGYGVLGVSSGVKGGWLAGWCQGLARHRGYWVGVLCEGRCGGASRVERVISKVPGTVEWRAGSSREGPGGVQLVTSMVRSPGRTGWWAAGQKSLYGKSWRQRRFVPCVLARAGGQEVGCRW